MRRAFAPASLFVVLAALVLIGCSDPVAPTVTGPELRYDANGATADTADPTATGAVAWYLDNSDTTPNAGYYTGDGTYGSHPAETRPWR